MQREKTTEHSQDCHAGASAAEVGWQR
eukprot:COSAG06_NODE_41576_length_390_cov_0.182131_1_plen_26_part_10